MLGRLAASLELLRPRSLTAMQKSLGALADGQQHLQATADALLSRLDALGGDVQALHRQIETLTHREAQLRAVMRADGALEGSLARLDATLDEGRIGERIRAVVGAAELHLAPFPYLVLEDALPSPFYDALLRGIPPLEIFGDRPFNKQELTVPFAMAPVYSRRVWSFFVTRVTRHHLVPALVDKFRAPLGAWIASNWPDVAADPFAPPMEFQPGDGRILLRGRGYRIRPHRDPKWGFLTCLLYLAREHDSERWGTQLYEVRDDEPARGASPHWIAPEQCRQVADVPFRRNTMLVFMNSVGAHGAHIPDDAEPADLQRYVYQCRIGPSKTAMRALMAALPEDRVPLWAGKVSDY